MDELYSVNGLASLVAFDSPRVIDQDSHLEKNIRDFCVRKDNSRVV